MWENTSSISSSLVTSHLSASNDPGYVFGWDLISSAIAYGKFRYLDCYNVYKSSCNDETLEHGCNHCGMKRMMIKIVNF